MGNKLDRKPGESQLDWLWRNFGPEAVTSGSILEMVPELKVQLNSLTQQIQKSLDDLTIETNPSNKSEWVIKGIVQNGTEIPITFLKANPLTNVSLEKNTDPNDCCNKLGDWVIVFTLLDGTKHTLNVEELNNVYTGEESRTVNLIIKNNRIIAEVKTNNSDTIEFSKSDAGLKADVRIKDQSNNVFKLIQTEDGLDTKVTLSSGESFDISNISEAEYLILRETPEYKEGTIYFIYDKGYIVKNKVPYGNIWELVESLNHVDLGKFNISQ